MNSFIVWLDSNFAQGRRSRDTWTRKAWVQYQWQLDFSRIFEFLSLNATQIWFFQSRWRHKEKKNRKICRRQIFFFDLSCHQTLSKKIWRLRLLFPKNFDLIIVLQFWRFQVRFYSISTRDRLTFRHEGDKRQGRGSDVNDVTHNSQRERFGRDNNDDMHANYFSRHSTSPNHRACIPLLDSRRLRTRECWGVTVRSIQLRWYPFLIPYSGTYSKIFNTGSIRVES